MEFKNYLYPKDYPNYKGRHVFYNPSEDLGYRIMAQDERKYKVLQTRHLIAVASGIMFSGLFSNKLAIILGVIVFVLLELYFRFKFLKDLKIEASFNVAENNKRLEGDDRKRAITSIVLIVLFAVVFVVFAIQEKDKALFIVSILIILISVLEVVRRTFQLTIK